MCRDCKTSCLEKVKCDNCVQWAGSTLRLVILSYVLMVPVVSFCAFLVGEINTLKAVTTPRIAKGSNIVADRVPLSTCAAAQRVPQAQKHMKYVVLDRQVCRNGFLVRTVNRHNTGYVYIFS